MDFDTQKMIETCFNARQAPLLLRKELLEAETVVECIQHSGLDEEFAIDLLSQMILAKRATIPTLVGLLKRHFHHCDNPFQACAEAIQHAIIMDLVDFDPKTDQCIVRFEADAHTHSIIRQYQYLPPMIVPPLEIKDDGINRGSGYLTVRTDSLLLKDNHHSGDLCVDSLNRFNAIPLSINEAVVKGIRNSWKNIDHQQDDETFEEYKKRREAFERYEKDSFETIALLIAMGNRFHMTHKPDKRGRIYAQGYHVNPQGNVWNKACVELADPELVV